MFACPSRCTSSRALGHKPRLVSDGCPRIVAFSPMITGPYRPRPVSDSGPSCPRFAPLRQRFPSVFSALRRTRRRRPARDSSYACPKSCRISSTATSTCAGRPARDSGGSDPHSSRLRARCLRCRSRSSARALNRSASRRRSACLARRRSRHLRLHVLCVATADGSGTYQLRHSQQRRRSPLPSVCVIRRRWQVIQPAANLAHRYDKVDPVTTAKWISNWPPPKRPQSSACGRDAPRRPRKPLRTCDFA